MTLSESPWVSGDMGPYGPLPLPKVIDDLDGGKVFFWRNDGHYLSLGLPEGIWLYKDPQGAMVSSDTHLEDKLSLFYGENRES